MLYSAPPTGAEAVVFVHVNAMDLESSTETLMRLRDTGFSAAAIEYVAMGRCPLQSRPSHASPMPAGRRWAC